MRRRFSSKILAKQTASAGAVVAGLSVTSATAEMVTVDVGQTLVPTSGSTPGDSNFSFDPIGTTFSPGFDNTLDGRIVNSSADINFGDPGGPGTLEILVNGADDALALSVGDVVEDGLDFFTISGFSLVDYNEAFTENEVLYFGYRYIEDQGTPMEENYYGYVEITGGPLDPGGDRIFSVNSYSFNNTEGAGITVVPEPSVFVLLLAGMFGVYFRSLRRRHRNA